MHSLRLIIITETKPFPGEIETIIKLLKAGLRTLHIRKPGYGRKKMRRFISSIPEKYHNRLVLHSHHELAVGFNVKGIHFTEAARRPAVWAWLKRRFFRIARPSLTISASYHTLSKVEKLWDIYDYIFLSPVFESISKKDKGNPLRHGKVQDCLRLTKAKVVALGGVDATKILACRDIGFYGVALVGAIWESSDPVENFKEIQDLCRAASPVA